MPVVLATLTKPGLDGFWVHLDVDVLDDALMPAVNYRDPGGLTWEEAADILGGLLTSEKHVDWKSPSSTRGSTPTAASPSASLTSSPALSHTEMLPAMPTEKSRITRRKPDGPTALSGGHQPATPRPNVPESPVDSVQPDTVRR